MRALLPISPSSSSSRRALSLTVLRCFWRGRKGRQTTQTGSLHPFAPAPPIGSSIGARSFMCSGMLFTISSIRGLRHWMASKDLALLSHMKTADLTRSRPSMTLVYIMHNNNDHQNVNSDNNTNKMKKKK